MEVNRIIDDVLGKINSLNLCFIAILRHNTMHTVYYMLEVSDTYYESYLFIITLICLVGTDDNCY